jgi:HEAT repeat protein
VSAPDDLVLQLTGGDETLAEAASSGLAQLGGSVLPVLLALLESSRVDDRWWAVRTLARMDEPPVLRLLGALSDPAAEIREAAVLALAMHPTDEMIPALVGALEDEDGMVPTLSVKALACIGKNAVPALLDAFWSASARGRVHIMHALAELGDHRAIPVMLKAMDEDSALLNYWAREGLERLGLNMVYIKPG